MYKYILLAFLFYFCSTLSAQQLYAKVYYIDYYLMPEFGIGEEQILARIPTNFNGKELSSLLEALKDTSKFTSDSLSFIDPFLDHRALIDIYDGDRKICRISFSNFGIFLYNGIRYDINCDLDKIAEKIIGVPFWNKDYCK